MRCPSICCHPTIEYIGNRPPTPVPTDIPIPAKSKRSDTMKNLNRLFVRQLAQDRLIEKLKREDKK